MTQQFTDYGYNPEDVYELLPRAQVLMNGQFWTLFRSGQAYTSTNGQTWTQETLPMYGVRSVAYGNGRYVAVGDYGIILVGKGTN